MWDFLTLQMWLSHTNVWMLFYWNGPNKYCDLTALPVMPRPCCWIWGLAHRFFFDSFRRRDATESQVLGWTRLQKSPPELLPSWHLVWNGKSSAASVLSSWKSAVVFHKTSLKKWQIIICSRIMNDLVVDHFNGVFDSSSVCLFSVWTWENALRFTTWHFGQIMKSHLRRETCSLSLM